MVACFLFGLLSVASADNTAVFKIEVDKPMSDIYDKVYASLEDARFFVVFEPNIGKNLSGLKPPSWLVL